MNSEDIYINLYKLKGETYIKAVLTSVENALNETLVFLEQDN